MLLLLRLHARQERDERVPRLLRRRSVRVRLRRPTRQRHHVHHTNP